MFRWLGSLVDSNEKVLRRLQPLVEGINSLEADLEKLSHSELRAGTDQFKKRLTDGATMDDLLPESFATVREAARRTLGQRHFDAQLMGGAVLHQGKIAEMKTGEGKTLVATLPLYLNALEGKGCHLVTVNDYLAKRDARWMGPIYHALGVSVASIQHEASFLYDPEYDSGDPPWSYLRPISRRQAYEADITYGTNNEFGFDYLRDNMVADLSQCVQRDLNYAIVDEVDNILIDEARTPLIISGAAEQSAPKYYLFAKIVPHLVKDQDYTVDEKERSVSLTDPGIQRVEEELRRQGLLRSPSLYDEANYALTHFLESALKAYVLFKRDRDYVVKDGQVIIVDEFTGRLMFGRRYSEGLHQAIEAKEGVNIQRESVTLATITFQNYFRLYHKLAGMTGTAETEAEEFHKIYKLDVVVIRTNKPMIRVDSPDQIYKTEEGKFRAVAQEIEKLYAEARPVLVGTVSIEKSEHLSEQLKRRGIPHQVLNAKYHEKEAAIIAQAGKMGAVTVATNMAGRGVDILLGGSSGDGEAWTPKKESLAQEITAKWPTISADDLRGRSEDALKVTGLGGLHIIGTERHEARRIDNQLRGRSGRQGDPGSSRFYVSLEDDIMRRFGGDRVKGVMEWAGMGDDTPIEHGLISKAIENAQVRVEAYHFDIRKHLVEYDDVVNKHREVIYAERRKILGGAPLRENVTSMIHEELQALVESYLLDEQGVNWNVDALLADVSGIFALPPEAKATLSELKRREIEEKLEEWAEALYAQRERELGEERMRLLERLVMLHCIDNLWVEHLTMMDHARQSIGLQAVGQQDPLVAYKREGHAMFQSLLANIRHDVVRTVFRVDIVKEETTKTAVSAQGSQGRSKSAVGAGRVGRNDPCPCGSGKKYKKCCGR